MRSRVVLRVRARGEGAEEAYKKMLAAVDEISLTRVFPRESELEWRAISETMEGHNAVAVIIPCPENTPEEYEAEIIIEGEPLAVFELLTKLARIAIEAGLRVDAIPDSMCWK